MAVTFACSTEARRRADLSCPTNLWKNAVSVGIQSAAKSCSLVNAKWGSQTTLNSSRSQSIQEERSEDTFESAGQQNQSSGQYISDLHDADFLKGDDSEWVSPTRSTKTIAYSTSTQKVYSKSGVKSLTTGRVGASSSSSSVSGKVLEPRQLLFWENMVCGAISRSVAQVVVHPMNTMKTILQANRESIPNSMGGAAAKVTFKELSHPSNWRLLTRGAGAQFLLSVPHGALNFAVLEFVRRQMNVIVERRILESQAAHSKRDQKASKVAKATGPGLDFLSSCISTVCCSIVSTPQMMITDNIMAGIYPNLISAANGLLSKKGILGFYSGWWPGLAGKIPSYVSLMNGDSSMDNIDVFLRGLTHPLEVQPSVYFIPCAFCVPYISSSMTIGANMDIFPTAEENATPLYEAPAKRY